MECDERLRYISAARVRTPAGSLDQFDVLDNDASKIGTLDGIVVDPAERRVRYFVLNSQRSLHPRHFLMPLAPATIDARNNALRIDVQSDDLDELVGGPAEAFPPFSDDDLMTALFSNRPH